MARIDDLPADQQAVLRLLLTQDRSYDEIARSLRMAPAAVRDRAHEALSALGPADTPLSTSRRAELTDWLLGQQGAAEARRTEDAVADSPAALAWARVVSGELAPVAEPGRLPELPEPAGASSSPLVDDDDGNGTSPAADRAKARAAARETSPSSRRGGAILLGVLALLAVGAIGFFVGRATKDDGDKAKAQTGTTAAQSQAQGQLIGQANLSAVSAGSKARGIVVFAEGGDQRALQAEAINLPALSGGKKYGLWLQGTGDKRQWIGTFPKAQKGSVSARAPLTVNPRDYKSAIITQESGDQPKSPGTTVLSGPIQFRKGG